MNGVNGTDNVTGKTAAERSAQKLYWTEHSVETTVEAMMLDSQAKVIDKEERPEVDDCVVAWALIWTSVFSSAQIPSRPTSAGTCEMSTFRRLVSTT
jgi:hypothetical protein